MPKVIYQNFNGGLSDSDRNIPTNQFAVGDGLDIHTLPGYMLPSLAPATVTYSGASPQIIDYSVLDTALDLVNGKAYHITDAKLYQETSIGGGAFNSNFDGAAHYYKAIGSASLAYFGEVGVVMYKTNDIPKLFYIYGLNVASGAANGGDIGRFDLSSTFVDTFMSGTAGGTGVKLLKTRHPYLEWNSILWVGNGRYLAKYDGTAAGGANGTWNDKFLDLGQGWEMTGLFSTQNYIGIVARKSDPSDAGNNYTFNRIFFFDGASPTYTYFTPLSENLVEAVINFNGKIQFIGNGRNPAAQLMQLTNDGNDILMNLRVSINGTYVNIIGALAKGIISIRDRILFILGNTGSSGTGVIASYGRNRSSEQNAFSLPFIPVTGNNPLVRYLKAITNNIFYFSYYDGSGSNGYYLSKVDLSGSTYGTANYKAGYMDFGQRVRINYVKFYYKSLVTGDSITPTLDVDYGTSVTLKDPRGNSTISYTNDSRSTSDPNNSNTSKRFNVDRDCHSFRPALAWTAGGTPFSKIVVDYSFLPDDN